MKTRLAWLNLLHDYSRTMVAIAGVAFAVILILMQLGFYFSVVAYRHARLRLAAVRSADGLARLHVPGPPWHVSAIPLVPGRQPAGSAAVPNRSTWD